MKLFVIFVLFVAVGCRAQNTNDITTKVFERDRDKDGKPDVRIETVSRGKTPILRVHQSTKGGVTGTTRSFMVGGDTVMMEADENGDGFFETIAVYHAAKNDMEVFTRQRDGSVQAVSAQTLEAYKEQHAALTEFWDKAFDKDTDPDKIGDRIQETQKKIRDAEKEKTDGKK